MAAVRTLENVSPKILFFLNFNIRIVHLSLFCYNQQMYDYIIKVRITTGTAVA